MVPHLARGDSPPWTHVQATGYSHLQGSKSVTVFARNQTWIAPQVASDDQKVDPQGARPAPAGKHHYIDREKERFRTDPEFFLDYRKKLESSVTSSFPLFLRGSEANIAAKKAMKEMMLQRIGPGREELKKQLIPEWSPGCRRLTVRIFFLALQ